MRVFNENLIFRSPSVKNFLALFSWRALNARVAVRFVKSSVTYNLARIPSRFSQRIVLKIFLVFHNTCLGSSIANLTIIDCGAACNQDLHQWTVHQQGLAYQVCPT